MAYLLMHASQLPFASGPRRGMAIMLAALAFSHFLIDSDKFDVAKSNL